jgi:hypothetical protein
MKRKSMQDVMVLNFATTLDKLKAYYLNENDDRIVLTERDKSQLEKAQFVFALRLRNKYSKAQALKKLQDEYSEIGERAAYKIYNLSMELFGDMDKVHKAAERMVLAENYWTLYQLSLKKGDLNAANRALENYERVTEVNSDENVFNVELLKDRAYEIKLSRDAAKTFKRVLDDSGVIDLNSVEDVNYEDI